MERTFIMIKPDGVQRSLIGEIVSRFEKRGLKLVGAKLLDVNKELAESHYAEHRERPFLENLLVLLRRPLYLQWFGKVLMLSLSHVQ